MSMGCRMDVDEIIEKLKERFLAQTDQQLAERLHVGRSTITSWRRRGNVPDRYSRVASNDHSNPFDLPIEAWSPVERAALNLALIRLTKGFAGQITDYQKFLMKGGFLGSQMGSLMEKALLDLSREMTDRNMEEPHQCVNLMVFEEFFDRK
jgi:Bacteriophage CI repressor helix-turn-helix domain